MRSIIFDELLASEIEAVRDYLEEKAIPSGVEDLYWIALERELWNETQSMALSEHQEGLMGDGYRLAVELGDQWVRFELLVRAEGVLNIGGGPTDEQQSLFVLRWANEMSAALGLSSCAAA
ncbi:MAG: hypothetical protein LBV79_00530 [Candidatus Adiutrix sp.]|nr:hypothetical protein [Candidatus Adiutrix sp.]